MRRKKAALTEIEKQYGNDNIISNKKCFYEIQYYLYHPDDIYKYIYIHTLYVYAKG